MCGELECAGWHAHVGESSECCANHFDSGAIARTQGSDEALKIHEWRGDEALIVIQLAERFPRRFAVRPARER
jgi:hypothetical protein